MARGSQSVQIDERKKKPFGFLRRKKKKPKTTDDIATEWTKQPPATTSRAVPQPSAPPAPAPANGILKVSPPAVNPYAKYKRSWFCRTKYFERMCDAAFDAIDADKSGFVDEKELYSGLLLIHLKLGMYAGPAACRPLSRERCETVFHKFDMDKSGSLDRQEFQSVISVLFGNVFLRVLVQWSMTLLIVPMVARFILDGVLWVIGSISFFISTLDERFVLADIIEVAIESLGRRILGLLPNIMVRWGNSMGELLEHVPESVWNAIPLAVISSVLGIVVVPYCIFQVDDFFQRLASHEEAKIKQS